MLTNNNKFTECNDALVGMFGYLTKDELLTSHISKLSPNKQPDGSNSNKKMLKMLKKAQVDGNCSFEWVHTKSDGSTFWTEVILTKIYLNDNEVIHGVWRDISKRKEAENNLEELNTSLENIVSSQVEEIIQSTVLFEKIFETVNDGLAILDLDSNFLLVNKAYEEITGYTKKELYQTSCENLSYPFLQGTSKEILKIIKENTYYYGHEKQCISKDGNLVDVKIDMILMPDKKSILANVKDMTKENKKKVEQQKNEQYLIQQSKMVQMGEMISMIAHQWRQPLSAISSTAIDLKLKLQLETFNFDTKDGIDEASSYFLNSLSDIENFIKNLTSTIDDFRNFYKPNKTAINISLKEITKKSLNIIKASLHSDNINIIENYTLDEKIDIYDGEMMQVILNIFQNSQDNFKEKNIENPYIKIKINKNKISICDNGGGIPEDILEYIFNPYFSTKEEKNGTGLGLYMSKIIVQDHHKGSLHVANTEDGVCFKIELYS